MLGLPTAPFNLDVWLIDANHFVVTDYQDAVSGTPGVIIGGTLVAQPRSPALSGVYAFTETGDTAPPLNPQAAGGIFTCGSTGILDVVSRSGPVHTNESINAACAAPANGRGLIIFSGAGSTASGIKQFAAYPTMDMGLDLIELDGGSTSPAVGPAGAGGAMQQTLAAPIAPTSFSGNYASQFLAITSITPPNMASLENFAGQIVSDGVSKLTGTADVNSFDPTDTPPAGTPSVGATLSGSLTANPNGRFPLSITFTPASGQPMPHIATLDPACYIVDANACLLLALDPTAPGTGILQMQQNLGF
jgi:hypothetical protein